MAINSGGIFVAGIEFIQAKAFGLISRVKRTSLQKFHQCVVARLWFYQGLQCLCCYFQQGVWQQDGIAKSGLAKHSSPLVCKWISCLSAGFNAHLTWNFCWAHCSALFQRLALNPLTASTFPYRRLSVQSVKRVKVKARTNGFALAIE